MYVGDVSTRKGVMVGSLSGKKISQSYLSFISQILSKEVKIFYERAIEKNTISKTDVLCLKCERAKVLNLKQFILL